MHPAYSVIFFTTASGAGYGLLVWLAGAAAYDLLPAEQWLGVAAFTIALGLITFGLLSSTFHLGHPERAWRGLTQWRTSWVSREGVAAIATYAPAGLFGIGWVFAGNHDGIWAWLGMLAALGAIVTIFCTGMIYHSLRAIPRWHNVWVVPVYLAFAAASGAILFHLCAMAFGTGPGWSSLAAAGLTAIAWALKIAYWKSIDMAAPVATAESATGLGHLGKVRLFEGPHTGENFLQREMGYRIARKHATKLRRIALILGGVIPVILLVLAHQLPGFIETSAAVLVTVSAGAGLLIERWLFFAEAEHTVTLYYGAEAV